jgi:DMSO/TMAO reductase YedYZ molybdopterin-dependent catalytic subunit
MAKSYLERKEAWAAKMIAKGSAVRSERAEGRLPPGQHTVEKLPVLDLGIHPEISEAEWRLEIGGLVEAPLELDWDGLNALPQGEDVSDFHCVTTWSKYDCRWGGVPMGAILDLVRPKAEAGFVLFTSYDGYTTNLPLGALFAPGVFLAISLDGEPLPVKYGGPARVVLPQLFAWKSAKFIKAIEFRAEDELGYWEKRGYSNTADPWLEERFAGEEVPGWKD